MTREEIFSRVKERKIIAIVRGQSPENLLPLAEALGRGGVDLMEITFQQSRPETWRETAAGIREITALHGERLLCGAGTVMSVEQARMAHGAGAKYIISPNVDEGVIRETVRLGMVSLPGAMTPTEIVAAHAYGADAVKVFPLGCLGLDYLRALRGPLGYIPLLAVGGVNEHNAAEFLRAGAAGLGIGGSLVDGALVAAGNFEQITRVARIYRATVDAA